MNPCALFHIITGFSLCTLFPVIGGLNSIQTWNNGNTFAFLLHFSLSHKHSKLVVINTNTPIYRAHSHLRALTWLAYFSTITITANAHAKIAPVTIECAASCFKHKTPTPIRGEPTNKTLKRFQTELQANSSSVETDLGGGNHGYLALVLSNAEHSTIPNAQPFVPSTFPPSLTIPYDATLIKALELKDIHNEKKIACLERKNLEKAILLHMKDAVENKLIESLLDERASLLRDNAPASMTCLFCNHGKVRSEEAD